MKVCIDDSTKSVTYFKAFDENDWLAVKMHIFSG